MKIAVYCASSLAIDQKYIDLAYEVGTEIARSGADLVWGGGKTSMMGAVARGARENGADVIGVIPERLISVEFADEESTQLHIVEDMRARKGLIEKLSHASITLPGGIGTLEEFFEIWVGRYLGFHSNPVVVCDPFGDYQPMRQALNHLKSVNFMKAGQEEMVSWCSDPATAVISCHSNEVKL